MKKPFTLIVQELEQKIVENLNEAKLPFCVLKMVIKDVYEEIERADVEEISKYEQELEKEFKESENK